MSNVYDADGLLPKRAFRTLTGRPYGKLLSLEGGGKGSSPPLPSLTLVRSTCLTDAPIGVHFSFASSEVIGSRYDYISWIPSDQQSLTLLLRQFPFQCG